MNHSRRSSILALLLLAMFASPTFAQGRTAIEPASPEDMTVYLGKIGSKSIVDGEDGKKALRIKVAQQGEQNWSVLHHSPTNTIPISKGDILVCVLRMRVIGEPTEVGDVDVYAESAVKEKDGNAGDRIHPTTKLQTFRRSVVSPGDFGPGEMRLSVHLAAKQQVIELYEVSLETFPSDTAKEDLAVDGITWMGREGDAPWRKEAKHRIEQLRKRDLKISVINPDGKPIEGASVSIEQASHAWRFGTFVGDSVLADSPDGERIREELLKRYNFLTLPAYLADWGWRNDRSRVNYFRLADWAQQHELPARGHLLVYPGWTATPPEWFTIPKTELRDKMAAHIPRAIRSFAARGVTEWDVTNELRYNEAFVEEIGGMTVAADWFKLARELNPNGRLYLNETVILSNGGHTETEQATLERHVRTLTELGAPIDGIGLQGHFGSELTAPLRVLEILDRMAKLDRDIMITEFDMDNDDKQAQADYIRDFYTVCFSHPRVKGIVQWGFWEGDMWKPRGHHFTKNWQETPVSRAYADLVLKEWWTNENGTSDSAGQYQVRAFQGRQTVTVKHNDYTWTRVIEIGPENRTIEVIVP